MLAVLAFVAILVGLVVHVVKAGAHVQDVQLWLLVSLTFLTAHLAAAGNWGRRA